MAFALALVHFVPAFALHEVTSDTLPAPLMFEDVADHGHPLHDWEWGAHSDVFPDHITAFLVDFFVRGRMATLQTVSALLLVFFLVAAVLAYRAGGGRRAGVFAMALLLFSLLLLSNFGLRKGVNFYNFLSVSLHTGTAIGALGCLALCLTAITTNRAAPLAWLGVLCFLTGFSDDLFIAIFPAPMLATLGVAALLYRDKTRMLLRAAAVILITSCVAHFLSIRLSPFVIEPTASTRFNWALAVEAWNEFLALCHPAHGGSFVVFIAFDVLYLLFGAIFLVAMFRRPAGKRIGLALFLALIFVFFLVGSNWCAELLTGNLNGTYATRQTRLAMFLPIFVVLGFACDYAIRSAKAQRCAVVILSLLSCTAAFFPPAPGFEYQEAHRIAPLIRDVMQKEGITTGLAGYWKANLYTFFSPQDCVLRAVNADGSFSHWLSTRRWYTGDDGSAAPSFRLLYMADLDPNKIRRYFGEPARIATLEPGKDVWIYPPEKAIRFNPVFNTLSNGPANELNIPADFMPSCTGRVEGTSIIAKQGRDPVSFIAYGPYPYLHLGRGRYRLTITYTYLTKPEHECIYDTICTPGMHTHWLDTYMIPYIDNARHEFTREFEVEDDRRGEIQVRIMYTGSCDFSFDGLKLVYLGK